MKLTYHKKKQRIILIIDNTKPQPDRKLLTKSGKIVSFTNSMPKHITASPPLHKQLHITPLKYQIHNRQQHKHTNK